jgi:hypothetical protein
MSSKVINKIPWLTILWLLLGLLSTASLAEPPERSSLRSTSGLPDYYPTNYQKTGIIRDVRVDDTLVISGLKYRLTADTKIHTTRNQFSTRWALKTGEEAGFSFTTDAAGQRTISEIWLLPAGRVVSH